VPPCHGALVRRGDGEPVLGMAMALPLLVGDNARWRRQHLRLGGRVNTVEVEVAARTAKPARRHADTS
jgi:hypothetical protein